MSAPCPQLDERGNNGPAPFAGGERRACLFCGAILAADSGDADGLCSPCRHAGRQIIPFAGIVGSAVGADPNPEAAHEMAAALLLLQHNLHPGEPLDLRAALACYGLEVRTEDLCPIVRWLRRRGFELGTTPGKSGCELLHWRHQFRRHHKRRGLTLFE